jgi:hypothetical protein
MTIVAGTHPGSYENPRVNRLGWDEVMRLATGGFAGIANF